MGEEYKCKLKNSSGKTLETFSVFAGSWNEARGYAWNRLKEMGIANEYSCWMLKSKPSGIGMQVWSEAHNLEHDYTCVMKHRPGEK